MKEKTLVRLRIHTMRRKQSSQLSLEQYFNIYLKRENSKYSRERRSIFFFYLNKKGVLERIETAVSVTDLKAGPTQRPLLYSFSFPNFQP